MPQENKSISDDFMYQEKINIGGLPKPRFKFYFRKEFYGWDTFALGVCFDSEGQEFTYEKARYNSITINFLFWDIRFGFIHRWRK